MDAPKAPVKVISPNNGVRDALGDIWVARQVNICVGPDVRMAFLMIFWFDCVLLLRVRIHLDNLKQKQNLVGQKRVTEKRSDPITLRGKIKTAQYSTK